MLPISHLGKMSYFDVGERYYRLLIHKAIQKFWVKCVAAYDDNHPTGNGNSLNLFSVNIHVHQKPSSAIFREGIRLGLVYRVRVSFR